MALTVPVTLYGALLGSYISTVLSRLDHGEPVTRQPSHCFSCGHKLRVRDVIPVYSYIVSKGRCKYCDAGVGLGVLLAELLGATLFLLFYMEYPPAGIVSLLVSALVSRYYFRID